jgi:putative peptide zinc metalloprotease protein
VTEPGTRTFGLAEQLPAAPHRAPGVELLGVLAGSGYRQAPGLVRRGDGQTLQLTPLLYGLLGLLDGVRDTEALAQELTALDGRAIAAADVAWLLEHKLRPLGLLRDPDGSAPTAPKANPLLALRLKVVVSDPVWTERLTRPFARLFSPYLVLPVLVAFAWTVWWVIVEHGLAQATRTALYEPGLLLAVVGLTVLSAGFHEFGHAAACRYGGARPGAMGAGLYLVWPAFYTDVDDSYRLSRWGRLRVDLGGLYFNALVTVATLAVWRVTGQEALLLLVATQLLQMLRQLAPFVRADGYHILADLTGVPDLFAHIKPTLLALWPPARRQARPTPLKRWARVVVSAWVLTVVPLLLGLLALAVWILPRLAATAWDSAGVQWSGVPAGLAGGDVVTAAASLLSLVALVLPVLAIVYLLVRVVRRSARATWAATDGRPRARAAAGLAGALLAALVLWSWWPQEQRTPIGVDERGTLPAAVEQLSSPLIEPVTEPVAAATAAPAPEPEAAAAPAARVLPVRAAVPVGPTSPPVAQLVAGSPPVKAVETGPIASARNGSLRFALPLPPREGDNQALAVNTRDGRLVFDSAYALVEIVDGTSVDTRNEAWALASCADCVTVAVAFQVVLVVADSHVVVPVNIAVGANDQCLRCVTSALAVQIVATLDEAVPQSVRAELIAAMAQLNRVQASVRQLDLDAAHAQVLAVEQEILSILERSGLLREPIAADVAATGSDEGAVPLVSPTATPATTPTATPSARATPTATPTATA